MIKRKPGFLSRAQQNAKKQGMVKVPKKYQPQGGEPEFPVYATQKEINLIKQQTGSKGLPTPFGIMSLQPPGGGSGMTGKGDSYGDSYGDTSVTNPGGADTSYGESNTGMDAPDALDIPSTPTVAPPKTTYNFTYDTSLSPLDNIKRIDVLGWLKSLPEADRPEDIRFETDPAKIQQYLKDNPEVAQDAIEQQGGPDAVTASNSTSHFACGFVITIILL